MGKTNCCRALQDGLGAAVIPEVNALFERPSIAPEDWYLGRQEERSRQCSYEDAPSGGSRRRLVTSGTMAFPDRYCLLVADEATLRQRREADQTRRRRKFERHLWLMEALPHYFGAVAAPLLIEVTAADRVQRRCQPPSR